MAWSIAASLYVIGFIGLNAMSRDVSTRPRRRRTIINLVFWPITITIAFVGDCYDLLRG